MAETVANKGIQSPQTRKYVYGIVAAAIPLLVIFGVIAEDQVQLYLTLAAAVLGFGSSALAAPNTPKEVAPVTSDKQV